MKLLGLILLFPFLVLAFVGSILVTVLGAVFGSLAGVFGLLFVIAIPVLLVLGAIAFFAVLFKIVLPIALLVGLVWLVVKAFEPRATPPSLPPPQALA